ncbi:MAG: hypothetical protein LBU89_08930 [Fibromonadaceae bacterium]|jgi:uncharacterized protein (TIGR02145 family)|nr:hypothetical protein [Fibromonadaceae bacterium]
MVKHEVRHDFNKIAIKNNKSENFCADLKKITYIVNITLSVGIFMNKFGFSALPGGYGTSDGNFYLRGYNGDWWSASEYDGDGAYRLDMFGGDKAGWADSEGINRKHDKSNLFSVRCVKN